MRQHKYNAKPIVIDGIRFASQAEGRRYCELKLLLKADEIDGFERQPRYPLPAGITYVADFAVTGKEGNEWVEDVKGYETAEFKLKKKLFKELYPHLELRIVKYGASRS